MQRHVSWSSSLRRSRCLDNMNNFWFTAVSRYRCSMMHHDAAFSCVVLCNWWSEALGWALWRTDVSAVYLVDTLPESQMWHRMRPSEKPTAGICAVASRQGDEFCASLMLKTKMMEMMEVVSSLWIQTALFPSKSDRSTFRPERTPCQSLNSAKWCFDFCRRLPHNFSRLYTVWGYGHIYGNADANDNNR